MPLYEFRCTHCGNQFTVLTTWSQKEKTSCPQCKGTQLQEVLGSFSSPSSSGGGTVPSPGCGMPGAGCGFG